MTFQPDYLCHPKCAAQDALAEQLKARKEDADEIMALKTALKNLQPENERLHMEIADVETMLDRFFHNAPIRHDGMIEANETGRHYFDKLSNWTYRNGKPSSVYEAKEKS